MCNDEHLEVLTEILHWMRFQNRAALRAALEGILDSKSDRTIYELTNGENSQPEIARRAGVSQPTVSNKWKSWRALGIIYEVSSEPGRCRHLASLQSVGLSV